MTIYDEHASHDQACTEPIPTRRNAIKCGTQHENLKRALTVHRRERTCPGEMSKQRLNAVAKLAALV